MSAFGAPRYFGQPYHPQNHICGLYYHVNNVVVQRERRYIPQVQLEAHATILSTTAKVNLKQTFLNPSQEKGIKEVCYTFPLYEGVSVVGFKCHVGARTIVGEVKEIEKAKTVFQEAVSRGETAALLEQLPDASDVFTTTIGNIPPGASVVINITYLGELKHDMEIDGIRFTIPNVICPRYGFYPGALQRSSAIDSMNKKIAITVDAQVAEGSFIQRIQSPSHPIAVQMGTTSIAPNAKPSMSKASATLTLGTSELETDFVLQIVAKDTGVPRAVLENHPTIPNHRALMATLVPKFALPSEKPEIVFVCDRSGSMGGTRINLVIDALKVFLKSLPVGVKFNICSFGSSYSFLWPKSETYSQQTLDDATRHAGSFQANYGGTEMLDPLKESIERRYKDMPLNVILLTDGEIWDQDALFSYLNEAITESKEPIRMFTLGIGNGVSHALIEGVAKAGNGFSQSVGEGEKMDTKVVRMLKGALSPHINDYKLEMKYHAREESDDIDDFEIIEKVTDSLQVKLDLREDKATTPPQPKKISLFDTSADLDKEEPTKPDESGEQKYAHLPTIAVPKIIQAPQNIPALFAFNRTTIYLLLGPDAPQDIPVAVVLRGTSKHGPLELEIPLSILDTPGETVHQLAAKKAIAELEQGRGWLSEAKDETGALLKTKFPGRFSDMVEREAVRLGIQFQVGGKWTSFVAVESNTKSKEEQEKDLQHWTWLENEQPGHQGQGLQHLFNTGGQQQMQTAAQQMQTQQQQMQYAQAFGMGQPNASVRPAFGSNAGLMNPGFSVPTGSSFGNAASTIPSASLFGAAPSAPRTLPSWTPPAGSCAMPQGRLALFGGAAQHQAQQQSATPFAASPMNQMRMASSGFFASAPATPPSQPHARNLQDYQTSLMVLEQQNKNRRPMFKLAQNSFTTASPFHSNQHAPSPPLCSSSAVPPPPPPSHHQPNPFSSPAPSTAQVDSTTPFSSDADTLQNFDFDAFLHTDNTAAFGSFGSFSDAVAHTASPAPKTPSELSLHLISHQLFGGSFAYSVALLDTIAASLTLGLTEAVLQREFADFAHRGEEAVMTVVIIAVFEERLGTERGMWELVVGKARDWMYDSVGHRDTVIMLEKARKLVTGNSGDLHG
ncbi:hypothetical protein ACN47E_004264 [Coniothyrium glycines]